MLQPRFVVDSAEDLIEAVRAADPPVCEGECAEIQVGTRRVTLRSSLHDDMMVWEEIQR